MDARDEPKPGTSKDDDISELSEPGCHFFFYFVCAFFEVRFCIRIGKISFGQKILNVFLFIWAFIESVMLSATNFFNRYTRDYRYVVKVLRKEKKILKVIFPSTAPNCKNDCFSCVCAGENQL